MSGHVSAYTMYLRCLSTGELVDITFCKNLPVANFNLNILTPSGIKLITCVCQNCKESSHTNAPGIT